jgi:6-phosphofructokinase 1
MEASLASIDVNICLVPEFGFELYGTNGLLEYVCQRVRIKRHCVIVVAEGACK